MFRYLAQCAPFAGTSTETLWIVYAQHFRKESPSKYGPEKMTTGSHMREIMEFSLRGVKMPFNLPEALCAVL